MRAGIHALFAAMLLCLCVSACAGGGTGAGPETSSGADIVDTGVDPDGNPGDVGTDGTQLADVAADDSNSDIAPIPDTLSADAEVPELADIGSEADLPLDEEDQVGPDESAEPDEIASPELCGPEVTCDDGSPCTADTCDPAVGCVYEAVPGSCDDGSLCTEEDQCVDGECIGVAINCEDGDPCSANNCMEQWGCTTMDFAKCGGMEPAIPFTLQDKNPNSPTFGQIFNMWEDYDGIVVFLVFHQAG